MLRPFAAAVLLMGTSPALAEAPELAFPRVGDRLRDNRYVRTVGDADAGPCYPKTRSRTGPLHLWSWPDWTVEHADHYDGRRRVETRLYGADGLRRGTLTYTDGRPAAVTWGTTTLVVTDWTPHPVAGAVLTLPEAADPSAGWSLEGGVFTVHTSSAEPVFTRAFRDGLARTVGGVPLDHDSRWIRGVPTARYRIELPSPAGDEHLHAWATTVGRTSYLFTWRAPADASPEAAEAVVALVEWGGEGR